MHGIVWEDKWRDYPDVPVLGDYIQVRVEHNDTKEHHVLEGVVTRVLHHMIWITPDPLNDDWCWCEWRRGALPEHRSVVRRKTVDA